MALTNHQQTELALKARDDNQALTDLILLFSDRVKGLVYSRMSRESEEDRLDIYQELMYQLCRSIKKFDGKSSFNTWFTRLQINRIIDYYRKKSRHKESLTFDGDVIDHQRVTYPNEDFINDEIIELYADQNSNIVYDRNINGYTYTEIAQQEHLSYEAIRSRYRRGRDHLVEGLEL